MYYNGFYRPSNLLPEITDPNIRRFQASIILCLQAALQSVRKSHLKYLKHGAQVVLLIMEFKIVLKWIKDLFDEEI